MSTLGRCMAGTILVLGASCETTPGLDPETTDFVAEDGDEALEWLMEGNRRFVEGRLLSDHLSARRRAMVASGQHPYAVILGCADSRVIPELIFDAGLGDVFVIRVAGNVADEDEAGSIEYALAHLEVPLVMVLGHEGCGAVTAALTVEAAEIEELNKLLDLVRPGLTEIDRTLPLEEQVAAGVEANVRNALRALARIQDREDLPDDERAKIVGAVYELGTGRVRLLDE